MQKMPLETEAKFYVRDLGEIEQLLQTLGARCIQPRTHEVNLRFDTPQGDLRRNGRVLRLRQDRQVSLTYKEGKDVKDGIQARNEIEFVLNDFEAARRFLEALGYEVQFVYEKYRTIYELEGVEIMLDELPYGNFVEIEGEPVAIRAMADKLSLSWDSATPLSYHALFELLRQRMQLSFRDLLFENFGSISISPAALDIPATGE